MTETNEKKAFEVFPWNEHFETGHEKLDKQHKKLVELLNKLALSLTKDEAVEVNYAFKELADYANYHFESEEEVWLEYLKDDSWFASHQLKHSSFLPRVLEIKENNSNEPLFMVIEDILKFLIRWLAFHIIDDDKRLALTIDAIRSGASLDEAKLIADKKMSGSMRTLIEAIMSMYDGLSARTLSLVRERNARLKVEAELRESNKLLIKLSITDELTGLYNRRYFEESFTQEKKRSQRVGHYLHLILIDLDYFKRINDTYGHSAGDQALSRVGKLINKQCRRPSDLGFRLGGEEFAILASTKTLQGGVDFADALREEVFSLQISNINSSISEFMTASIGIVSISANETDASLDHYLGVADKRMYQAKTTGRNKIVYSD